MLLLPGRKSSQRLRQIFPLTFQISTHWEEKKSVYIYIYINMKKFGGSCGNLPSVPRRHSVQSIQRFRKGVGGRGLATNGGQKYSTEKRPESSRKPHLPAKPFSKLLIYVELHINHFGTSRMFQDSPPDRPRDTSETHRPPNSFMCSLVIVLVPNLRGRPGKANQRKANSQAGSQVWGVLVNSECFSWKNKENSQTSV